MREFAFMQLEAGDDDASAEAQADFDEEIEMAAEGRFDELGIDDGPLF